MRRSLALMGFVLLVVLVLGPAAGDEEAGPSTEDPTTTQEAPGGPRRPSSPEDAAARVGSGRAGGASALADRESPETLAPDGTCELISSPETRELCWQARRAYFTYYIEGIAHRTSVFRWQHLSTRTIFFVVLLLVALGIYFAWVQFHRDEGGKGTPTELEIGASSIKVSSSVLGVIILVISLGFFSLYLIHVYPIREIL